jgi:predicted MFS family arabinose efflux permease
MSGKVSSNRILRTLSHRGYAIFTAGNLSSMSGEWIQRVGVGWLVWEMTHSASWLGIIACADMLPAVLISPLAGAYSDRMNRLRFIKIAVGLSTLQPFLLMTLYFTGLLNIHIMLALALFNAVAGALRQSAWHSVIPYLVDRESLPTAVALGSVTFNLSRFIGPAIAGPLIATVGPGYTFVLNFVSLIGYLVGLHVIKLNREEIKNPRSGTNILTETLEGFRYTVRHPGIAPLMFLLLGSSIGQRPFVDLLPGFAAQVFERGPEALGWMVSMVGLGALIGGLFLAMRPSVRGQSFIAINAILLGAIGLLGFSLSQQFWLALVCLAVAGSSLSLSGVGTMSLVQLAVEDNMRGRVMSIYGLIFRSGPALGTLIMGFAAEYVGLRWPVAVGAGVCVFFWAITVRRQKMIAKYVELDAPRVKSTIIEAKAAE